MLFILFPVLNYVVSRTGLSALAKVALIDPGSAVEGNLVRVFVWPVVPSA